MLALLTHLDLEGSLKATGKEATKGTDDTGKDAHEEGMNEEGVDGDGGLHAQQGAEGGQGFRQSIFLGQKGLGWFTLPMTHLLQLLAVLCSKSDYVNKPELLCSLTLLPIGQMK